MLRVIVTGYIGAGKSTIKKIVEENLGDKFLCIDTDDIVTEIYSNTNHPATQHIITEYDAADENGNLDKSKLRNLYNVSILESATLPYVLSELVRHEFLADSIDKIPVIFTPYTKSLQLIPRKGDIIVTVYADKYVVRGRLQERNKERGISDIFTDKLLLQQRQYCQEFEDTPVYLNAVEEEIMNLSMVNVQEETLTVFNRIAENINKTVDEYQQIQYDLDS